MKLIFILQGWFYYLFKNKKVEKLAANRIYKCLQCPHSKFYNQIDQWKHETLKFPKTPGSTYCTKCNCPISKKTRSPKDKCPIGKW